MGDLHQDEGQCDRASGDVRWMSYAMAAIERPMAAMSMIERVVEQ
jgi:hypothetical protein